jgi:hypothetical protein
MEKTIQIYQEILDAIDIGSPIKVISFLDYKTMKPKKLAGCYVIKFKDRDLYAGLGQIFIRQGHHHRKGINEMRLGTRDTKGWKWGRDNTDFCNQIDEWKLIYAEVPKEKQKDVEDCLKTRLEPLFNDESTWARIKFMKPGAI